MCYIPIVLHEYAQYEFIFDENTMNLIVLGLCTNSEAYFIWIYMFVRSYVPFSLMLILSPRVIFFGFYAEVLPIACFTKDFINFIQSNDLILLRNGFPRNHIVLLF